jgi:hypothetical protein
MKLLPTPRRLLTLDALFARRSRMLAAADEAEDTRMPDDADVLMLQQMANSQMGRLAAEVALQEGGSRQYAPRGESQVMDVRRERGGGRG